MADAGLVTLHHSSPAGPEDSSPAGGTARLGDLPLGDQAESTVSVHDVYRDFLRHELDVSDPRRRPYLNQQLLLAVAEAPPWDRLRGQSSSVEQTSVGEPAGAVLWETVAELVWWRLPTGQRYLHDNLAYHLHESDNLATAERIITRPAWIAARLTSTGLVAALGDLQTIASPKALALRRWLASMAHLLGPTAPPHAHIAVLWSRLRDWTPPNHPVDPDIHDPDEPDRGRPLRPVDDGSAPRAITRRPRTGGS